MRKKNKTKRRNNMTFPVAVIAGFIPGITRSLVHLQAGGFTGLANEMSRIYLGYDMPTGKWQPYLMWYGFAPIVLGLIVHRVASMIGVNRALARARIPLFRV